MEGWEKIISDMEEETKNCDVKWTQIKEKFGTLRAYHVTSIGDYEKVEAAVKKAEALSAKTCIICSEPGKIVYGGWALTLCGECEANRAEG